MPITVIYENTSEEEKYFPLNKGGMVPAGGKVKSDGYIAGLDAAFEVVTHAPSPVKKLHASTIGDGITLTGLEAYRYIRVQNQSGADIVLTFNEDETDTQTMPNGKDQTFDNDSDENGRMDFTKLVITGAGESNVLVNAWK